MVCITRYPIVASPTTMPAPPGDVWTLYLTDDDTVLHSAAVTLDATPTLAEIVAGLQELVA